MKITKRYMTQNDCYNDGKQMPKVKGAMVHSTASPGVMAADWFDRWNKSYKKKQIDRQVAVTFFVDDKSIYQYLPETKRAWHCGKNEGNTYYIGFEICEPKDWKTNKTYFEKAYANAVWLGAYLVKKYKFPVSQLISHAEGYKKGIASNHGDPAHWWKYFGKDMNDYRADVEKLIEQEKEKEYKEDMAVKIYKTLEEIPECWKEPVEWAVKNKICFGVSDDNLGLTEQDIKALVFDWRLAKKIPEILGIGIN